MANGPTDEQNDWVHQVCGINLKEYPVCTADDPPLTSTPESADGGVCTADDLAPTSSPPNAAFVAGPGFVAGLVRQSAVEDGALAADGAAAESLAPIAEGLAPAAGEAAPAVGAGAAEGGILAGAGAVMAGVAVGIGILLWPSETAPAWEDEINPETGNPYKSPQEYEEVQRRRSQPKASSADDSTLDRHDEERYAEDVTNDPTASCDAIIEAIKGLIKALRERYDVLAELGGGDAGHRKRYQLTQGILEKLIAKALANQCAIDVSEAKEWAEYPLP
jgi:hypothetical protein